MPGDTMQRWLRLQQTAHSEFGRRLAAVTAWDAPTPASEWSVRDLVHHVVEEQQWVPPLLAGLDVPAARRSLAPLGPDLVAEWRLYSLAASAAWAAVDPASTVRLSSDVVPAADYLREQVSEVTIHAWDLARAVGADELLDADLIAEVWTVFEPQKDTLAASGLFAPSVRFRDDASLQSRLLALTGRDDRAA